MITFGIKPEFYDGFGYLQISENQIHKNSDTYPIKNFIEKPSKTKAKKFLEKIIIFGILEYLFLPQN